MKFIETPSYPKGSTEIRVCQTEIRYEEANFALDLMSKIGLIACKHDGEDSSGRQKLALLSEEEVVARATKIANLAFKHFRENNLMLEIPLPKVAPEKD